MPELTEKEEKNVALMEAFLFHFGEPVSYAKLAKALKMKEEDAQKTAELLFAALRDNPRSGLCLIASSGGVQLSTKPELQDVRKSIIEDEWKAELTPASQETLSIIAYLGPISKIMIDYVRGVNSGFILRNLLVRGLVEREPSKTHAHSYDYHVTNDFLRHMGLSRPEELPEYEKYRSALTEFAESGKEDVPAVPAVLTTDQ
jgi:segregation and condensation protein B